MVEWGQPTATTIPMRFDAERLKKLTPLISALLFCIAAYVVGTEISNYGFSNVAQDLLNTPQKTLGVMLVMTVFGYLTLGLCEWVALKYSKAYLPLPQLLFGAFLSNAISHNVGSSLISGGSIRYRFYSEWGLPKSAIAKVTALGTISYFLSAFCLLLIAYLWKPEATQLSQNLAKAPLNLLLIFAVGCLVIWFSSSAFHTKAISIKGFSIAPPSPSIAFQQVFIGTVDLTIAAIVLYIPLLNFTEISFPEFLIYYLVAQLLGLVSQVPGGIGIFESSFLYLASEKFPAESLLSSLIIYRIVYYILPLIIAGLVAIIYETKGHRVVYRLKLDIIFRFLTKATPQIFSYLLLAGGAILLVSGAYPRAHDRLEWLQYFLPLSIIEFSHLLNSIVGLGMIFLSRAVRLKIDTAYFATIIIICLGIVVSLSKGWDFEEASVLGIMLLAFIPTRKLFYRKSALLQLEVTFKEVLIASIIIGFSTWLGFASYRDVAYSNDLWWQMTLEGDAPRFLRSLFAISLVIGGFLLLRLMSKTVTTLTLPTSQDLDIATTIVHDSNTTNHHLVLTGDKYILWSKSKKSFIMFGITPGYWVAMSDPVGDASEFEALVWEFREKADKAAAHIAFYQIGKDNIPLYLDLGLSLIKLGQQALIPLSEFSLEGKKRQNLRSAINKYQREGYSFELIYAKQIESFLPELQKISDEWLLDKNAKEKRFSLGFFNEEYLKHCDVAVVKKDGHIFAFTNIWMINNKRQISIDLMRYSKDTPNGIMEYLNVSLIMWAKAQGFEFFSLGMAPLSGLEDHELAPLWHKVGNSIFKNANDFYNFEGVFFYKEKFNPSWQPIYLAAPPGLKTASALLAATTLISGGVKGIFTK